MVCIVCVLHETIGEQGGQGIERVIFSEKTIAAIQYR